MDSALTRRRDGATSLQERVRIALEERILSGAMPPGSAIDERALAAQFGASRTPVREALLLLAAQGLVQIVPRAGIYVRKATVPELVATLEALTELEVVLAALAARRAGAAQRGQLGAALAAASACAQAGDRKGYEAANAALHEVLYAAAANPVLVQQVRAVRRMLGAYRQRSMDKPGRLAASDREHQAIVQAVCAGDEAAAARTMRLHIELGGDAMMQRVRAAPAAEPPDGGAAPAAQPPLSPPAPARRGRRSARR